MRKLTSTLIAAALASPALAAEGDFDPAFSSDGRQYVAFDRDASKNDALVDLCLLGDGSIVLAGTIDVAGNKADFGLAKLAPDGAIDGTFGFAGRQTYQAIAGADDKLRGIACRPDGRTQAVGTAAYPTPNGFRVNGVLATVDVLGAIESTHVTLTTPSEVYYYDVTIPPDGRALVAGAVRSGLPLEALAVRYETAGAGVDASFNGGQGELRLDVTTGQGNISDSATAIVRLPDGRTLIAGETGFPADFFVARLTAAGALDATFGDAGVRTIGADLPQSSKQDYLHALAVAADGTILLGGTTTTDMQANPGTRLFVAALTPEGQPKPGFGNAGRVVHAAAPGTNDGTLGALALQSDGRILAGGTRCYYTPAFDLICDVVVLRLDPASGALDPTWGNGGRIERNLRDAPGDDRDILVAMVVDPRDRIILGVRNEYDGADFDFAVARLVGPTVFADGFE